MTLASQVLPTEVYTITGLVEYIPIGSFLVTNYLLTFVYDIILIFGILIAYHIGKRHGRREARRLQREQRRAHHYTDQEWQEWHSINDPGYRPDIKRMIPAEIRHLVRCGYVVLGDNEVNAKREEFVQSLRPSIEDYLTQEQTDKIINGEMDAPSMPMHPEEWDEIGRAQRDAMMSVLEDALMLGLDYEEMDAATVSE